MIAAAVRSIERNPTEAQKSAGNYAKGHVKALGFDITIENARGSFRRGIDRGGKPWQVRMPAHYGYLKRTEGADGDNLDVYLGPHLKSPKVFVVDQVDAETGKFDEHKAMIGFASFQQARNSYLRGFSDGKGDKRIGCMTEMGLDQFKRWLNEGDTQSSLAAKKAVTRASGGRVSFADGGLVEAGNIDLARRPIVRYPDGSISTVRSMSIGTDRGETLIPTVSPDGRVLANDDAIALYRKTGQHLGIFSDAAAATAYAEQLSRDQEKMYARPEYADGGAADDWQDVDDWTTPEATAPERSLGSRLASPITDIPKEAYDATAEALSGVNTYLNPFSEAYQKGAEAEKDQWIGTGPGSIIGTGKGLLSAVSVPFAPIQGALRSVVGHPYSAVTGMPYEQAKEAVDTAVAGMAPRGVSPVGARTPRLPPRPAPTSRDEVALAAERLDVPVPVAGATDSLLAQRTGAAVKEIPFVGDPLVKASKRSIERLGEKAEDIAGQYGSGNVLTAGDAAKTAMADWITGKSATVLENLYQNKVDPLINQRATRPLHETQSTVADLLARRMASGENSTGKAVDIVGDAITRPGGLTYQGTKDLRTRIGSYLDGSILPEPGTSMPELKQLYTSLTKDLRGAVLDFGGPPALKAFDKANSVAEMVARRREALAKIVGKDAGMAPEGVLDRLAQMASTKSSANVERLILARKAIGQQGWDEVASAIISRIGRDPSGNFSPDRFATAFGKMSDEGKRVMFSSTGRSDLLQSLNDIATISQRAQQIARFGNPSGTGRVTSLVAGAGALWAEPLTTIATAIGGNALARALARPVTAKALARWSRAYSNAMLRATPPNRTALGAATANLARALGEIGLDPLTVFRGAPGLVPSRADQEQE